MPKRKSDEPKFYAVRRGRKPGVYDTWDLCKAQIDGFKGAQFKSFTKREHAADWAAGKSVTVPGQPIRYYAVAVGRAPGVYTDWTECQEAYSGVGRPKFAKFDNRAEAQDWIRSIQAGITPTITPAAQDQARPKTAPSAPVDTRTVITPLEISSDEDQEDGFTPEDAPPPPKKTKVTSQPASKPASKVTDKVSSAAGAGRVAVVYTDGSSLGNGRLGASAGLGVYFGENDPRNISERLKGNPQTNQRAELMAILRCLEVLGDSQPAEIRSDSKYSIQCVTEWYVNWEKNGWKAGSGGDVKNVDIIKPIRERLEAREKKGVRTQFIWVKGHSTDPGNNAADELAVAGARMAA